MRYTMAGQRPTIIVQASSRSWGGGRDLCMNLIDGKPAVFRTVARVLDGFEDAAVTIAAPAFDRGGELDALPSAFPGGRVAVCYGHDASPLDRMLEICSPCRDDDYILRVDGLHFCFDVGAGSRMLEIAKSGALDCVKFPDDFQVQFTSDVYRVGALRKLSEILAGRDRAIFSVHPKYYLFMRSDLFRCTYLDDPPRYADDFLAACRKTAESIYAVPRQEVTTQRIWSGDRLGYHYELAADFLAPSMRVLDIACGDGFGTEILSKKVRHICGADIDKATIAAARQRYGGANVTFQVQDVTALTFPDNEFDAVASMETIEHVDAEAYLSEVRRVLRPGGLLILSTPQNTFGRIPVNSSHLREYSLREAVDLCSRHFLVITVIGFKAGIIFNRTDPYGTNTMLVCVKERR